MTGQEEENEGGLCDLCGLTVGLDWEWDTPNRVATAQEAREKGVWFFEDPIWHICDTCHRMILANKPQALLERALQSHKGYHYLTFVGEVAEIFNMDELIKNCHKGFWLNKADFRRRY